MTTFYKLDGNQIISKERIMRIQECDNCKKCEKGNTFWGRFGKHLCNECKQKGIQLKSEQEEFFEEMGKKGLSKSDIDLLWKAKKQKTKKKNPNFCSETKEKLSLIGKRSIELYKQGMSRSEALKEAHKEID